MKQAKRTQLIDLAIDGLMAERKREKQWYFEVILEILSPGSLDVLREDGIEWLESVEPDVKCCAECGEPLE